MTDGSPFWRKFLKREPLTFIVLFPVFDVATHLLPIHTTSPELLRTLETAAALFLALLGMAAVQKFLPPRRKRSRR